jgi:hypothetical protein
LKTTTRLVRPACLTVTIASLLGLSGCQIFSIIAYKTSRTPEVQAMYVPTQKPVLVLVEKSNNPGEVPIESQRIGRQIGAAFEENHVAPLADASALSELRSRNPAKYSSLSPAAAGRLVHAGQVLYVDLIDFTVEDALATELSKGRVEARVRLIASDTGETMWPMDTTQGYPIAIDTPFGKGGERQTTEQLRDKMCQDLADKIGKLFYKYRADEVPDDMATPTGQLIR